MTVSNSTPLIALGQIGLFDLLRDLFGRIRIAEAVYRETVITGRDEGGARREVSAADWIEVVEVDDRLAVEVLLDELDRGEAETIVLARQLNAEMVLMDEKKGRRKLQVLGMPMMGTLGILLAGKEAARWQGSWADSGDPADGGGPAARKLQSESRSGGAGLGQGIRVRTAGAQSRSARAARGAAG